MLSRSRLVAFVASSDLDRAEAFYVGRLGLAVLTRNPYVVVLDADNAEVRVTLVEQPARAPYTVLGWDVDDLDTAIDELTGAGVEFTRYDGMSQDVRGSWTAPDGSRIAWFRDPDGNTLSLAQHAVH